MQLTKFNWSALPQGRELKNDERTCITSSDGQCCLLLQNITTDDSGKYDVCIENKFGADAHYASVSVEGDLNFLNRLGYIPFMAWLCTSFSC